MIKVTEYERIATVTPSQSGQFKCPKCGGVCSEKKNTTKRREWDCIKCHRGWIEIPDHIQTVDQALDYAVDQME